MKKLKVKIYFLLAIASLMAVGGWWVYSQSWKGQDLTIMEIGDKETKLINVSPTRRMINTLAVVPTIDLWIPNGMGWYPASKLPLILEQKSDQKDLSRLVAFFNFGFWPEKVVLNEDWRSEKLLWKNLGPLGWLRFRLESDSWLEKSETINRQLESQKEFLDEVMSRDLAESKILESNVRMTVINASGKNGFGNFVADRLDWWGMMVTSVLTQETDEKCQISFDQQQKEEKDLAVSLASILKCQLEQREGTEMELKLGVETEGMVKYSETYVRSF